MELQWPLILFTFFLCLAGGTIAFQGVLNLMGKGKEMQTTSLIVSAVSLVVGGIAVFMHLQHWERIFNAFGALLAGNGTAVSGITLELWGCVALAVALLLFFLFMRRSADGVAPKWCAVLAIIVGLALPVVTGASYLMASIPAWNTPLLLVYYLLNACLMGSLVGMIIAAVKKDSDAISFAAKAGLASAVLGLVVVIAYAAVINGMGQFGSIDYYFDPVHPDTSMVDSEAVNGSIMAGELGALYWGLAVAVGLAVPAVLAFMAAKADAQKALAFGATALVCVVIGSIAWRAILYMVAISAFALF